MLRGDQRINEFQNSSSRVTREVQDGWVWPVLTVNVPFPEKLNESHGYLYIETKTVE